MRSGIVGISFAGFFVFCWLLTHHTHWLVFAVYNALFGLWVTLDAILEELRK